jgi:pyrroline-5-carboxylate reductase
MLTAYAVSERVRPEDSQLVKTIFSAGGLCESVPERLLNPVGALSGSGPAYVRFCTIPRIRSII